MVINQFKVEFRKDGTIHDEHQVTALLNDLTDASDLLVLSHGWNNDMKDASELYDAFMASFNSLPQPNTGPGSKVVVMRIFWPSKKFTNEELIPGGGAASAVTENDVALRSALEALKRDPDRLGDTGDDAIRAANINEAIALIGDLEESETARRESVLRIRAVLNPDHTDDEDASREFFELEPEELFDRFGQEVPLELTVGVGGVASVDVGGAAFLGDLVSGITAGARRIANFATYFQMKSRAGTVGTTGLAPVLMRVRTKRPDLPIHLVGHSFGGRLVTAAAAKLPHQDGAAPVTMTLLQAAFSHNGLAQNFDDKNHDGAFRTILKDGRISGPIVITHTKNDTAVGIAYPLASRIAFDKAAALGDQNDPYGGMGRNGAQHTPEVSEGETELHQVTAVVRYAFKPGRVYNLNADAVIKGHSDITSAPVAKVVADAIAVR